MADTDHIDEDEVLRRMLTTPPKPHKPLGVRSNKKNLRDPLGMKRVATKLSGSVKNKGLK